MEQPIDPKRLARLAILWITIWVIAQSLYGIYSLWSALVLSSSSGDTPLTGMEGLSGIPFVDLGFAFVAFTMLGSFLVSGILVLRWIYRTNANAHLFAQDMSVSPGWNVGWFFVPIANLWKPFEGIRETWQVSHDPANWPRVEIPDLMRWWWGCWLVMNVVDSLSFRLSIQAKTVGAMRVSNILDIVSAIIGIPLAVLLIWLIRRMTEAQTHLVRGSVFA